MLQKLTDLPPGIDGIKAVGAVSSEEYERVLEPMLADASREGRGIRFLYELGPEMESYSAASVWEDIRASLAFLRCFEGCAIVSDVAWIRDATSLVGMGCPVRVFAMADRDQAIAWLASLVTAGARPS